MRCSFRGKQGVLPGVELFKDNIALFRVASWWTGDHLGFDTDTLYVFDLSIEILEIIKIGRVAVNIFIPYPETEFYWKFEKEGRIICTGYTKYTGSMEICKYFLTKDGKLVHKLADSSTNGGRWSSGTA